MYFYRNNTLWPNVARPQNHTCIWNTTKVVIHCCSPVIITLMDEVVCGANAQRKRSYLKILEVQD
jgi:hypothetical protein